MREKKTYIVYFIKNYKRPKTHFKAYICVVSTRNLTKFNLYHVSVSRPRLAYVSSACYVRSSVGYIIGPHKIQCNMLPKG